MADATLKEVAEYFGIKPLSKFRSEWEALSEEERAQLRAGIGNGSLTY